MRDSEKVTNANDFLGGFGSGRHEGCANTFPDLFGFAAKPPNISNAIPSELQSARSADIAMHANVCNR